MAMGPGGATSVSLSSLATGAEVVVEGSVTGGAEVVVSLLTVVSEGTVTVLVGRVAV